MERKHTHTHTHCHYVCIILGMLSSISTTDTKATTISQHFFIKCSQSFSSLQPLTIIYSRAPTQNQPLHHSQAKAPFHTIYSSCRSRPPGLYQCIKNSYTRIFFYVKQVSHHLISRNANCTRVVGTRGRWCLWWRRRWWVWENLGKTLNLNCTRREWKQQELKWRLARWSPSCFFE